MRSLSRARSLILRMAVAAALLVGACRDESVPTGPARAARVVPNTRPAALFAGNAPKNLDNDFEALAKTLPGFAGLYYVKGVLTVVLTDTSIAGTIAGPIANFLARDDASSLGRALSDVGSMRVVRGDYDWTQLAQWNRQVLQMGLIEGVTQTDIDEVRNRISIGVTDDASAARVHAALDRLQVPAAAVIVEHIPPTRMLSDSLVGVVRPPGGGVAIEGPKGYCTLGYNAYYRNASGVYDGKRYFITASHCTSTFGVVDSAVFGQPNGAYRIGVEVVDPNLWDSDTSATCPVGYSCRYSDAAAVQYDDSVAWKQGKIAFTNGTFPFLITDWYTLLTEGDNWSLYGGITIKKVGASTGLTSGTVLNTCVNVVEPMTTRVMLCQSQGTLIANFGDSGSGVFHDDGSGDANPLIGVLWGAAIDSATGITRVTYAHWYNVTYELARAKGGGWFDSILGACSGCGYSVRRPQTVSSNK